MHEVILNRCRRIFGYIVGFLLFYAPFLFLQADLLDPAAVPGLEPGGAGPGSRAPDLVSAGGRDPAAGRPGSALAMCLDWLIRAILMIGRWQSGAWKEKQLI